MSDNNEPQEEMELEFHTDMPVGEILRRTRRHYGQTLDQIEQILRIRAQQLEALENGEIHKLPGRVYAIGFVRSYSEYLGLDGDKMVHLFKEQSVGKQKKPELSFPVAASESKIPNLPVIVGSIAGVLLLIGFISFLVFPESPQNEIPPVPETLTKSQLNEAPALVGDAGPVDAVKQNEPEIAADGTKIIKNRIQLEIVDSSWVEIKNKEGVAILRQVLKPGDIYMVPNEPGMTLATGNAGGIKVKVDGKDVGTIGAPAAVKRNVKLDPDSLIKTSTPVPTSTIVPSAPPTAAVLPEPPAPTVIPSVSVISPAVAAPVADSQTFEPQKVPEIRPAPQPRKAKPPARPKAPSPDDGAMINQ